MYVHAYICVRPLGRKLTFRDRFEFGSWLIVKFVISEGRERSGNGRLYYENKSNLAIRFVLLPANEQYDKYPFVPAKVANVN